MALIYANNHQGKEYHSSHFVVTCYAYNELFRYFDCVTRQYFFTLNVKQVSNNIMLYMSNSVMSSNDAFDV